MILETIIREAIKHSLQTNNIVAKEVLRLALGTIQQEGSSKNLNEEQKLNIVRKLIKSNETTIAAMHEKPLSEWSEEWQHNAPKLAQEITTLQTLLPQTLTFEETKTALAERIADIKTAKSDGMALGLAMKFFKQNNTSIDNNVVKQVVENIRNV